MLLCVLQIIDSDQELKSCHRFIKFYFLLLLAALVGCSQIFVGFHIQMLLEGSKVLVQRSADFGLGVREVSLLTIL